MANSDRYVIIKNEKSFLTFLDRLGDIYPHESYLISTNFRSKKLSEEDKKKMKNNGMYLTKYLRGDDNSRVNSEKALQRVYELEVPFKALTFNKGKEDEFTVPQEAIVTFIACNPSNEIKVAMEHLKSTNDILANLACDINKEKSIKELAHINTDFRSERMKNTCHKWVDFDIDLPKVNDNNVREQAKNIVKNTFKNSNIVKKDPNGIIISTDGGFHILLSKDYIKDNPNKLNNELTKNLKQITEVKEISFKTGSALVPLPGSLQYGEFEILWEDL